MDLGIFFGNNRGFLLVCFLRVVKTSLESDPSRGAARFLTASCPARPLRAAGAGRALCRLGALCAGRDRG